MNRRGSVFIMALALLAGLVAILAGAAASQRLALKSEVNRMENRRARLLAQAGIQRAVATLYDFITNGNSASGNTGTTSSTKTNATLLTDDWAIAGNNGADKYTLGQNSYRLQIVDANAFVNLNAAPEAQLNQMPFSQQQIDCLLDWREAATTTSRSDGAKDTYYNALTNPYNAKLGRLSTINDLLMIRGFTGPSIYDVQTDVVSTATIMQGTNDSQATLYDLCNVVGYTPMTQQDGTAKINVNALGNPQQKIQRMIQAGISPALAAQLSTGNYPTMASLVQAVGANDLKTVLNVLTVDNTPRKEGRINLNTAGQSVLSTIPNITPDVVQAIVQRQSTGLTQLGDIVDIPGLNSGAALAPLIDYVTVASQTFLVRVVGTAGGSSVALEAVIDMQSGSPKILSISEAPFSDMPTRWGWDDATTETPITQS